MLISMFLLSTIGVIPLLPHFFFSNRDKPLSLSPEVVNALCYLEEFTHYAHLPRRAVEKYIPAYVFAEFRQHYYQ